MEHNANEKLEMIYVISNPLQAGHNLYKIGRHSSGMQKLLTRYNTSIPNAIIYFCHDVKTGAAPRVESTIHAKLAKYRVTENSKTEWFQVDLMTIITIAIEVIRDKHDDSSDDDIPKGAVTRSKTKKMAEERDEPKLFHLFIQESLVKEEGAKISYNDLLPVYHRWVIDTGNEPWLPKISNGKELGKYLKAVWESDLTKGYGLSLKAKSRSADDFIEAITKGKIKLSRLIARQAIDVIATDGHLIISKLNFYHLFLDWSNQKVIADDFGCSFWKRVKKNFPNTLPAVSHKIAGKSVNCVIVDAYL